jgi:hypothetical protein
MEVRAEVLLSNAKLEYNSNVRLCVLPVECLTRVLSELYSFLIGLSLRYKACIHRPVRHASLDMRE